MKPDHEVVVAGHICLDIIPGFRPGLPLRADELFIPGHLIKVEKAVISPGGPVANTGLALRRLGIAVQLMGKVGDDLFGRALGDLLAAHGVDPAAGMLHDSGSSTSYTVILNPPGIDRIFFHCPGANDTFNAGDIHFEVVAAARLFHFGYPPVMRHMYENGGTELAELFRRVKETGVTTSLDMTLPDPDSDAGRADWRAILAATLPYVDLFMPSLEEICFMLGITRYHSIPGRELLQRIGGELLGMGAGIVGIKLGEQGLYLQTAGTSRLEQCGRARPQSPETWADRSMLVPCFKVMVGGTTGAGDAAIAGFIASLLRGLPIDEAATKAAAAGACCVEAADAVSGLLSWEEMRNRIAGGWERL